MLSFCDPLGVTAVLESCRSAMAAGDKAAVQRALQKALRLTSQDWSSASAGDVAQLLDGLHSWGVGVETVRMLGQAAAGRRQAVPVPLVKSLLRCAATEGQPGASR